VATMSPRRRSCVAFSLLMRMTCLIARLGVPT